MFRHQKLIVYNLYGEKVALNIVTKPNCFGYVDIINDEVGHKCLSLLYNQAMEFHNVDYVDRFVSKPRRREEWGRLHKYCMVCLQRQIHLQSLEEVPDYHLNDLFVDAERFNTPLRRQKLSLFPPPDPRTTTVARLPDDETTILELRRELFCQKMASTLYVASLKSEIQFLKEQVATLRSQVWCVKKDLEKATRTIRRYSLVVRALPDEVFLALEEVDLALDRKLDELLV